MKSIFSFKKASSKTHLQQNWRTESMPVVAGRLVQIQTKTAFSTEIHLPIISI